MNKNKLTAVCHKISREKGLSFNSVMIHYFLETILQQLSESKYRENFIFKGGFLLSNVVGIAQRSTIDIDFVMKKMSIKQENLERILTDIFCNSKQDLNKVSYEIISIENIREEDEYGGYRFNILCKLDNIRQVVPLDIATGDPITPSEILYKYKSIFSDDEYFICAYNIETILAEKIQTVYKRGVFNSRSKDFYDIYLLFNLKKNVIDYSNLYNAFLKTFEYRKTPLDFIEILHILEDIRDDKIIIDRWNKYTEKYSYAKGILFEDTIDSIIQIIKSINKISI